MEECLDSGLKTEGKVELREHQKNALASMGNGKILFGPVGSGKTITSLAYYMDNEFPKDIYVITTAKKRDSLDWEGEAAKFGISTVDEYSIGGKLTVDSWNNIGNYIDIKNAFFVFDEQRLVGHGTWVKHFFRLAEQNHWILLTGTPGDVWIDYAPVFIANGWYKNITDFKRQHVVYAPYVKFPKIQRYVNTARLERLRSEILVEMPYESINERILNYLYVSYDTELWDTIVKKRWNVYEDRPIKDVGELFRLMRRVVNTHESRIEMVRFLMAIHPKLIIFYNFDYELDLLRELCVDAEVAEWNGHRKHPIPDSDTWVYLVQYASGSESWNCIETDAMVLYSLTYSYKQFIQSQGRIDRMDSPYTKLYYYVLVTTSAICQNVIKALENKKSFNEMELLKKWRYPANNLASSV